MPSEGCNPRSLRKEFLCGKLKQQAQQPAGRDLFAVWEGKEIQWVTGYSFACLFHSSVLLSFFNLCQANMVSSLHGIYWWSKWDNEHIFLGYFFMRITKIGFILPHHIRHFFYRRKITPRSSIIARGGQMQQNDTKFALRVPCRTIMRWFVDRTSSR